MDKNMMKLDEKISNMLLQMGATPNLSGYHYLKEGIIIVLMKNSSLKGIMDIYGHIAQHFDSNTGRVERNIRNLIDIIWALNRINVINECLGVRVFNSVEKPTNGQFIYIFADRLSRQFFFNEDGDCFIIGW